MKRAVILAAAILALSAMSAYAGVFEHESLIIAGDAENTYVTDMNREEDEQTEKICSYPPAGNFCVYEDKLYFDTSDKEIIEYDCASGESTRIGSLGWSSSTRVFFAGVLDERLYFTVSTGYEDIEHDLKYVDLKTGEITDCLSNVYNACVWDGQLFVTMVLPDPGEDGEKQVCFGPLSPDLSTITHYSMQPVAPEEPDARTVWAGSDALYFQDYAVDEETGERTGVCLRKVYKDPEGTPYLISQYGFIGEPGAVLEYLSEAGGWLFIRVCYPENTAENMVVVQSLSDDSIYDIIFTGETTNQKNSEMFFSDNSAYYFAADNSFWQLSFSDTEDQLIARFPDETEIQGVTETAVYFVSGGDLYSVSIDELKAAAPEPEGETQSPEALIKEITDGVQKTLDMNRPAPLLLPEFFRKNPQAAEWVLGVDGEKLQALLSLDFGMEIDIEKENRMVSLRLRYEGREEAFDFEIPEELYAEDLLGAGNMSLEELLEGNPVTSEERVLSPEDSLVLLVSGRNREEIPCRVYHTCISWRKVEEIMQNVMSGLSSMMEALPLPASTGSLPDITGEISSLEDLAGDGISLDFYIDESGCIGVEAVILKSPKVFGALGSRPELKRISDDLYTPGLRWCAAVTPGSRIATAEGIMTPETNANISILTEMSDGSYPNRNYAGFSLVQYKVPKTGELVSMLSFPMAYGAGSITGNLTCRYLPTDNTLRITAGGMPGFGAINMTFSAPEISGNDLIIPVTIDGFPSIPDVPEQLQGVLTLSSSGKR